MDLDRNLATTTFGFLGINKDCIDTSRDDDRHHRTALVGEKDMPPSNGASAHIVRNREK